MKVSVSPAAEQELSAAVDWYEQRRARLGLELIVEIDRALGRISSHPTETPLWRVDRPYRKKLAKRFPYAIFFRIEGDEIAVDAIAHVRRRPGFWQHR